MSDEQKNIEKPPYGPGIVRGWFDGVLNPLIAALSVLLIYLRRRTPGWNAVINNLEAIHPVEKLIAPLGEGTLNQFLRFHPEIADQLKQYEEGRERLLEICRRLQELIQADPRLKEIYDHLKTDDTPTDAGPINEVFSRFTEGDHLRTLAQLIIHGSTPLPTYNAYAPFWAKHSVSFLKILDDPKYQQHLQTLDQAIDNLRMIAEHLSRSLQETRDRLSLEFDVPYIASYVAIQLPGFPPVVG
jgi:hypothetical protein